MSLTELIAELRKTYKAMLLNKEQTSRELNISQATLDRLRKDNKIEAKKVPGQVMFRIDEVARYLSL